MSLSREIWRVLRCFLQVLSIATLTLLAGIAHAGVDNWTLIGSPTVGSAKAVVTKLVNDPTNSSIRYAVGGNGIFKSIDDGATWSAINAGIIPTDAGYIGADDLVVDPLNHNTLYVAAWAAVQKSINGGTSWTRIGQTSLAAIYANTVISALAIDPVNSLNVYGATNHGMYKSTDGGNTWANMASTSAVYVTVAIDPLNAKTLYATNSSGEARKFTVSSSSDTTALIVNGIYNGLYGYGVTSIAPDPRNAGTVYAATSSGMYKSTDGGSSWSAANNCYKDSSGNAVSLLSASSIAFDPSNSAIIYVAGNRGLYKSVDGAGHWTLANVNAFGPGQIVVDLNAPNTMLSGGGAFGGIYAYAYSNSNSSPPSDCLFNWAERTYPTLFAPTATSSALSPYYYRYYSQNRAYLATSSTDNHVYYLGPLSGNAVLDVGALTSWLLTAGCQ